MTIATSTDTQPLLLNVSNTTLHVTPEQFDILCLDNRDLRLELSHTGELIVMTPAFPISGKQNADLVIQVGMWNKQTKLGEVFDSSTGYDFTAIGGGKPSPDVSWIEKSRLEGISLEKFLAVVPDFIIELRSTTDRLNDVRKKMLEYQRLGVRLGLLINPQDKKVEIYRQMQETEILDSPTLVSCEAVLTGLVLSMDDIL
jgi:Uma2 family endonuclease